MESDGDQEKFFNRAGQIAADKMSQTIDAATKLAGAEKGATKSHDGSGTSGRDDSTRATKDREKEPGSSFKNNVGKDKDDKKGGFFKGKGKDESKFSGKLNSPRNLKAAWKKGGPVGLLIALLLLGGGGLMLGSQTAMPFAIANRLTEEFNTMGVSNNLRYNHLFRYLATKDKLSKKQVEALKKQGIEIDTKAKSGEATFTWEEEVDGQKVKKSETITKDKESINRVLDSNPQLQTKYQAASQNWKGQNSGWYDRVTSKIFNALGLKNLRSHFQDYQETGDKTKDVPEIQKKIESKTNVNDSGATTYEEEFDDQGNKTGEKETDVSDSSIKTKDKISVTNALKAKAKAVGESSADVICGTMAAAGAISAVVVAQQMIEMMNMAGAYLESVQKVQAGEGAQSPMHYLNERMTESGVDGQGNRIKTAMESTGMSSLFNNTAGTAPNDNSTLTANIEGITQKITFLNIGITFTANAFLNCTYARMAQGATSLAIDVVSVFTAGLPKLGQIIIKASIGAGIGIALVAINDIIIPWAADIFIRNLAVDTFGEDLGNAITSGATEMMSKNHQGSGGSPGTEAKVFAFRQQQQIVLAEQAEYDRATLSPFDASSRYTFLGTLVYNVLPKIATITDSSSNVLSQTKAVVSDSLASLLPSASAVATTNLNQYKGSCPLLESVGGIGDAFCNPYYVTDTSTITDDEDQILQIVYSLGGIDDPNTLNPKINKNSKLAMYQEFCGNRQSVFGTADAAIASNFDGIKTDNARADAMIDGGIGVLPFVGGASDMVNAVRSLYGQDWVSGKNCIATDEPGSFWQTEGKYYQRFIEDQRLLTNMEVISNSNILAFSDEYREQLTADQSYEAQLARMSGLTKDQVIDTLALMDEYEFLANYDPSDLGPLPVQRQQEVDNFSSDSVIANINHDNPIQNSTNLAQHYVIYADLRTRTQVA